jgi:arsenite methyltransferase
LHLVFLFPIIFGKTPIPNQNPYHIEVIFDLTSQTCSAVCEPGTCDTFQFMAKTLKMKVLHPGGLHATRLLAEKCKISSDMIILDAGCGSGRSDIFIAKKYGCRIVGVDIETVTLLKAQAEAVSNGLGDRVVFRLGNANDLPFQDQIFDGAIFQAALIFTNKTEALHSVYQKVRSGGFLGVIELAWKKPPTENIVTKVRETLCAAAVNTETHSDWIQLFRKNGFEVIHSELLDHKFSFRGIFKNEGLLSSLRFALKCINVESVKKKMGQITSLFKETGEYLGYGIYVARKR